MDGEGSRRKAESSLGPEFPARCPVSCACSRDPVVESSLSSPFSCSAGSRLIFTDMPPSRACR